MPFKFSNMFKDKTKKISVNTMVGLTETGKKEITRYSSAGFEVIDPLDDRSPQSVGSLMRETGMSYDEIIPKLEAFERQRYIEFFGRD